MPRSLSPAVLTALSILELLGASQELGVTELARKLGMGKSSVHRLLNTLAHKGYIEKNPQTGRYRLTYQLFAVATAAAGRYGLKEVAAPVMERLATEACESVNLGVLEADRVLNIHKVQGPHPIRLHIDAPGGVAAYATGLGKVLLAGLASGELERRLAGARLARLTPTTITTRRALLAELRRVRTQGYAVDNEECSAGVRAVAAPVCDRSGSVVAAISVAGPTHRLSDARLNALAPAVRAAVAEISRRLGFVPGVEASYPT
jgi:IclR family KDG regulon transcriptional repressor